MGLWKKGHHYPRTTSSLYRRNVWTAHTLCTGTILPANSWISNGLPIVCNLIDTLSVLNADWPIRTKVFRKETHADQYLNFLSNHPLEHKRAVVRTLAYWAKAVVSEKDERQKEIKHLRGALRCIGNPEWILKELEDRETVNCEKQTSGKKEDTHTEKRKFPVVIPFIKGFSEKVRRVFGKFNILTYFQHLKTITGETQRPGG